MEDPTSILFIAVLRENYPNTDFFLVQIQENKDQKKLRIWTLFTQCQDFLANIIFCTDHVN